MDERYVWQNPDADTGVSDEEILEDLPKETQAEAERADQKEHPLDTDKDTQRRFRRVLSWWAYERAHQADNRRMRLKQHEYRDGEQWDPDDANELENDRGTHASVYNLIHPAIEWVSGTERRTRVDYLILPTSPEMAKAAEIKTKAFKYVNDVNNARWAMSQAFEDAITSGLGWLEVNIRGDQSQEPIYIGYEDWRYVWHDSLAVRLDLEDARYLFRAKWVDYDVAVAMFPDRADVIRAVLNSEDASLDFARDGDDLDIEGISDVQDGKLDNDWSASTNYNLFMESYRPRVRIVSCEYRVPLQTRILRPAKGGNIGVLDGVDYDEENPYMVDLVKAGHATVVDSLQMRMRKMIFCGRYVLLDEYRPYNHNIFSLIPVWGYRRKKDGAPYGLVYGMMDPQEDYNKSFSKARWILSSNQTMYESGAIDDIDKFSDEKARPDGNMEVNDISKVQMQDRQDLAVQYINIMQMCREMIDHISGVTPDNRGMPSNATSGEAIRARQAQGHVMTGPLFDNYLLAHQQAGRVILSLIEQYWTEKKTFRITRIKPDEKGKKWSFVTVNDGLPENDITANRADFVVSQEAYHATLRQAMFEEFGKILAKLPPEISVLLLDWWIDLSDLPGKDVAVERIRAKTGQHDPYADPEDPEVKARLEAERQAAERKQQIENAMIDLELKIKQAQATKDMAQAQKLLADARARLAEIGIKSDANRIKKADVLHKIEQAEASTVSGGE